MTPIYDSPQAGTFIPVFAFALDEGWCPYAAEYRKWTKVSAFLSLSWSVLISLGFTCRVPLRER